MGGTVTLFVGDGQSEAALERACNRIYSGTKHGPTRAMASEVMDQLGSQVGENEIGLHSEFAERLARALRMDPAGEKLAQDIDDQLSSMGTSMGESTRRKGNLLYEMFGLREAGVAHGPLGSKKKDDEPEFGQDADSEDEPEEFGADDALGEPDPDPNADYYDPTAGAEEAPDEPVEDEPAEEPAEPEAKFASQSAPMPKIGPGIRVSGDKATLEALQEALQEAESLIEGNDDLADWCAMAWKTLASSMRRGEGVVNLPKYEAVPEDMDPDAGEDDEE